MTERLHERAAECCRGRHCEEAISVLAQILRGNPHEVESLYHIGFCHSGACRRHALIQPDVAREHLLEALRLLGPEEDLELQARILSALGYAYAHSEELSRQAGLQSALECHEKAAALYWNLEQLDSWAREQHNLGNTWCVQPESASPDKWQKAVEHYENALVVRTRERNPRGYAATLQNLGTAYRELPAEDRGANVRTAIDCYRKALRVYTVATLPQKNAALHNNLGNAYLSLPDTDRTKIDRNALRALRHFERALRRWTRREHPCDCAIARYNSGPAMMRLAISGSCSVACRREAAERFREAARCWELCGSPGLAAATLQRCDQVERHAAPSMNPGPRIRILEP